MANKAQVIATTKHRKKRMAKGVSVTLYLDNQFEKNIYNEWKKIDNKKEFIMEMLSNRIKNKKNIDKNANMQ